MDWVVRNWLVLAIALALLTALSSWLDYIGSARLLVTVGWIIVGVLALVDGIRRAIGQQSLLGTGGGLGTVLALVQITLAILLLIGLIAPLIQSP